MNKSHDNAEPESSPSVLLMSPHDTDDELEHTRDGRTYALEDLSSKLLSVR